MAFRGLTELTDEDARLLFNVSAINEKSDVVPRKVPISSPEIIQELPTTDWFLDENNDTYKLVEKLTSQA